MSPQLPRLSVVARALVAVAAAVAVPLAVPTGTQAYVNWGTVLVPSSQWVSPEVAELGDLNIYSNGTGGQDQSDPYGLAYECVELAQRYAAVRYGEQKVWPVSAAYQMWSVAPSLQIPFQQLPNGGAVPPQAGDLLIFDHVAAAPFGHVAVVSDVGPGYVDIVEQNWNNVTPTGTARLPIDGTTMPARGTVPIIGWLRSSTSALPFKPALVTSNGNVYPVAGASSFGGPVTIALNQPIVGAAGTPDGKGYWMVAADGGVFSYGDAQFYGTTVGMKLNAPIIGMTATADGKGYWLYASDGGIFSFGDAAFYGSTGNMRLNAPVIGMAPTPGGKGYWLVAKDGGVFTFGDGLFYGSTGNMRLNQPVNGMAATADGKGYWLTASDGGIFSFGDALFYGSTGNITVPSPVVKMVTTGDGNGYWLVTSGGTVYAFGDARWLANSGVVSNTSGPVVGMVATVAQQ